MTGDALYDPLGQDLPPPRRSSRARVVLLSGLALGATLAVSAAAIVVYRAQRTGPAVAVVPISAAAPPAPAVVAAAKPTGGTAGILSATDIDRQSGVVVTRPAGTAAGSATIIQVPQELGVSLQRSPDLRLVEQSRYGVLPRRGPDGARPLDVYARPLLIDPSLPPNAPRIALVVGAMGLNAPHTAAAATELPPAVTLAFAPYGDVLDAQVQSAREAGHEAILQVPMESVGTASATTLSHLLVTGDPAKETLDRLHWHMTRFTGYVGVANFLGATFTADATALGPVLGDVAQRGLLYFDDGTAARSQAAALAPGLGLPVVRADVVIDTAADTASVDRAFGALERRARDHGTAVGFASGGQASLDRIEAFARGLAGRGMLLVPLSALANGPVSRAQSQP